MGQFGVNVRSLKNLLRVTETGSLTAAAADARLSVQAIAAQINKIEDSFGFALFERTSKGMTPTEEGQILLPRIRKLIAASSSLDEGVAEIRGQSSKQLRIAMNTTLTQEAMSRLLDRFMAVFSGFEIQFSAGETHENLRNLREQAVDIAVFLGPPVTDVPFVDLHDFHVSVISASTSRDVMKRVAGRVDRYLIRPSRSCPYSIGFDQFVEQKFSGVDAESIETRTIVSSSEQLTASLIRQVDGIGILSQDVARSSSLAILPDFEVLLPVRLAVDSTKFEGAVGKRLRSLGVMRPRAVAPDAELA